jgi:hypothetical protein
MITPQEEAYVLEKAYVPIAIKINNYFNMLT